VRCRWLLQLMGMDEGRRNEVARGNVFQPDVGVGWCFCDVVGCLQRWGTRLHKGVLSLRFRTITCLIKAALSLLSFNCLTS
jgi:hypothetical protein